MSSNVLVFNGRGNYSLARELVEDFINNVDSKKTVEYIKPEDNKKTISIEQLRTLRQKLALSSGNTTQIYVIESMQNVESDSQTTLLKSLEELDENKFILMPVSTPSEVLPTILSRSNVVTSKSAFTENSGMLSHISAGSIDHASSVKVTEEDLQRAVAFMKDTVRDKITNYKNEIEDRDTLLKLIESLRIVCISTMRSTESLQSKKAWAQKIEICNELLKSYHSHASSKLLLLSAAVRL